MAKNLSILSIILIILFGCERIFHEEDDQYIEVDSKQEVVDLLNGIYFSLTQVHDENYIWTISRSDDVNAYYNYFFKIETETGGTRSCHGGDSTGAEVNISETINSIYSYLYKAVLNANKIIEQRSENAESIELGEAYFLRAYSYFKLARLFGQPPIVKDVDVNLKIEKPSYKEVYEFIEKDLLRALELLPQTYTNARIPEETPHQGTVKALLAEVYLAMAGYPVKDKSKYELAARYAGEVINEAELYNFALLEDYGDLWKQNNAHNRENIFGLFYGSGYQNAENNFSSIQVKAFGSNAIQGYFVELRTIFHPTFSFFNRFPKNYRKGISFIAGVYDYLDIQTEDTVYSRLLYNEFDPLTEPCQYILFASSTKWFDQGRFIKNLSGFQVTLYLLRYGQTLLTYAESKARIGEMDDSAYEAINKIRRRANFVNINTPSEYDLSRNLTEQQFIDSVVTERAWELNFEPEGRWFDIVRLELRNELDMNRHALDIPTIFHEKNLSDSWYFYAIPQEDKWINPNFNQDNQSSHENENQ